MIRCRNSRKGHRRSAVEILAGYGVAALFLLLITGAGLGSEFRRALPGYRYQFPQDHAAHPGFRTEWWYYTGHLAAAGGRSFGFQLTFFRHVLRPANRRRPSRWALHTLYFAHFALTDEHNKRFQFSEKVSRGSLGLAGAGSDRYRVWIDDWQVRLQDGNHKLSARTEEMALDLVLQPDKKPVIHGKNGISQKAEGEGYASHYYSITRMQARGKLTLQGRSHRVMGQAWMDHEFGSNQLRKYQIGWDWFSVQLDNHLELMVYLIRHRDGRLDPSSSGTIIFPDSSSEHLPLRSIHVESLGTWRSARSKVTYPSAWRLRVSSQALDITLTPTVKNQELTTHKSTLVNYWEGSVSVKGTYRSQPVGGRGYVELTGYDAAFGPEF